MNNIYIYHHLGLGDHFLCNAIVRIYAEKYHKVYLFCKPKYLENVSFLYRDLNNIKMIPGEMNFVDSFMKFSPNNNYLIIGHTKDYFDKLNNGIYESFDKGFYEIVNIPFEEKWNKFYLQRDLESEKNVFYNVLNLKDEEEFFFVHDEPEKNRNFRKEYIEKGVKIINANFYKNIKIYDFLYTIEKAEEVHVMNSSFSCLIDTMQLKTNKLFLHEYARTDMGNNPNHKLKLDWIILR